MAQAARKVTAKGAGEKPAHRRVTVLELAERLGMRLFSNGGKLEPSVR